MNNVIEQYLDYLNTARKQYNGLIEKPARDVTINKFTTISKNSELDVIKAKNLVEAALTEGRRVWNWSDQHFNHDMLWKKGYRAFHSREEMNSRMLSGMETIQKDDVLIFGGDLCFYDFKEIVQAINKIECQKIYIVGNHDVRDNSLQNELRKVVDALTIAFDFNHSSILNGSNIVVSHYPFSEDKLYNVQFNLHGHTHQYLMGEKHINMCVEHTNYIPIVLSDLILKNKTT